MKHLPSLQTLRAFEAAGRLQSYSRAAEELGLTHGAVSHRIRALERTTRSSLFRRDGNRMVPTTEGHKVLSRVRHALQLLDQAFQAPGPTGRRMLSVSVLPALAARWLIPRLGAFRMKHPAIELDLSVSSELVTIGPGGVDLGLRYGPGGWPGLQCEKLAEEVLFPVCAPAYRDRSLLEKPVDLDRATLLRNPWQPWGPWLQRAAPEISEPNSGPSYSDAGILLQAAAAGEGVALARGLLAADDLRSGKLVRLFDAEIPDTYAYFAVWQTSRSGTDAEIEAFRGWIRSVLVKRPAAFRQHRGSNASGANGV